MHNLQKHLRDSWNKTVVFTTEDGNLLDTSNIRRSFYNIIEKANLSKITFHDLRHTHATLMLENGMNPKIVSERLCHSSVRITLDTYSHALPNLQSDAAVEFASRVSPKSEMLMLRNVG